MSFTNEEHQILKWAREYGIYQKTCLVSVSGGIDSLVMLHILWRLQKILRLNLHIVHFHHGGNLSYRNSAQNKVKELAQILNLKFTTNTPEKKISSHQSEAELRAMRINFYKKLLKNHKGAVLALGHNKNDLVETQMLKLIRGVGQSGIQAIPMYRHPIFRPLIHLERSEISKYFNSTKWNIYLIEDPSNQKIRYSRNYIRHQVLNLIEKKFAGSVASLAQSFNNLANHPLPDYERNFLTKYQLDRIQYLTLSGYEKKQVLAIFLKNILKKDYTAGLLQDLQNKLETTRNSLIFAIGRLQITMTKDSITGLVVKK